MRIAGTNVFVATFALGTILALLQPMPSLSGLQLEFAQANERSGAAVVSLPSATDSSQLTKNYLHGAEIASFEEKNDVLMSMRSAQIQQKDKSVLATAKVQAAVAIAPELEQEVAVASNAFQAEAVVEVAPTATPTPIVESYQLNADVLFEKVNNHRVSIGLAPLQKDPALMDMAVARGPELFDEIFVNGNMHAGFHARAEALPYWANENIIYFNTEDGAFNWWMNSPVHRASIENPTYTHTGIACDGKACSQIFTGFQPK